MIKHSASIPIIQPLGGMITCLSNTSLWQKVALTWGATTITFEGAGKGMPLKLADGTTTYPMVASLQDYTIHIQFHYSPEGAQGPFFNAIVEEPILIPNRHHTQILISADAAMEYVNNDTMLLINYERMDKPHRTLVPGAVASPSMNYG